MRFEGRTAFVTGGASGIGAATARRLAAEGAHVWVADVDEELWDVVLGVNLRGVIAVTHAVLPSMHERRGGAIVSGGLSVA
jgi:NAD(P)-dependent dehydrogenase (short-subunit alcohol dehydrogenase family)